MLSYGILIILHIKYKLSLMSFFHSNYLVQLCKKKNLECTQGLA